MFSLSKKGVIRIIFLYHGTIDRYAADIVAHGIDLSKSKPHLDFGPGFYTTPDFQFALETARSRANRYNSFRPEQKPVIPSVLTFECDDALFQSLNQKTFDKPDSSWGRFILANRCESHLVHECFDHNIDAKYDIVFGPTADGKGTLTPIVEKINTDASFIEQADYNSFVPALHKTWGRQISFHTMRSLFICQ